MLSLIFSSIKIALIHFRSELVWYMFTKACNNFKFGLDYVCFFKSILLTTWARSTEFKTARVTECWRSTNLKNVAILHDPRTGERGSTKRSSTYILYNLWFHAFTSCNAFQSKRSAKINAENQSHGRSLRSGLGLLGDNSNQNFPDCPSCMVHSKLSTVAARSSVNHGCAVLSIVSPDHSHHTCV